MTSKEHLINLFKATLACILAFLVSELLNIPFFLVGLWSFVMYWIYVWYKSPTKYRDIFNNHILYELSFAVLVTAVYILLQMTDFTLTIKVIIVIGGLILNYLARKLLHSKLDKICESEEAILSNFSKEPGLIEENIFSFIDYSVEKDPWHTLPQPIDFEVLYSTGGLEGEEGLNRHEYVKACVVERVVRKLNETKPEVLLDVVCGPALYTFDILAKLSYIPERVMFLDVSLIVLKYVEKRFKEQFPDIEGIFILSNGCDIPLFENSVDTVLSFWGLTECFPYTEACLKEIEKILKTEGCLLDVTLGYDGHSNYVQFFDEKAKGNMHYFNMDGISKFYSEGRLCIDKQETIFEGKGKYLDLPNMPATEDDSYKVLYQVVKKY